MHKLIQSWKNSGQISVFSQDKKKLQRQCKLFCYQLTTPYKVNSEMWKTFLRPSLVNIFFSFIYTALLWWKTYMNIFISHLSHHMSCSLPSPCADVLVEGDVEMCSWLIVFYHIKQSRCTLGRNGKREKCLKLYVSGGDRKQINITGEGSEITLTRYSVRQQWLPWQQSLRI